MARVACMLLSVFGVGPASAGTLAAYDLDEMAALAARSIELRTHREFEQVPEVVLAESKPTMGQLLKAWKADAKAAGEPTGALARGTAKRRIRTTLDHSLALYADGRVYLVEAAIDEVLQLYEIDAGQEPLVVECLIVHELAHALQDQVLPSAPGAQVQDAVGATVVSEGFATLVQSMVCATSGFAPLAAEVGLGDIGFGIGDALYGYGWHVLREQYVEGGADAMWAFMADPSAEFLASLEASPFLRVLDGVVTLLGIEEAAWIELEFVDPKELTYDRSRDQARQARERVTEALVYHALGDRDAQVSLYVGWFREAGQPAEFVDTIRRETKERRSLEQARVAMEMGFMWELVYSSKLVRLRGAEWEGGAQATFGVVEKGMGRNRVRAYWAADDTRVFVIYLYGVPASGAAVAEAIRPLFTVLPDEHGL